VVGLSAERAAKEAQIRGRHDSSCTPSGRVAPAACRDLRTWPQDCDHQSSRQIQRLQTDSPDYSVCEPACRHVGLHLVGSLTPAPLGKGRCKGKGAGRRERGRERAVRAAECVGLPANKVWPACQALAEAHYGIGGLIARTRTGYRLPRRSRYKGTNTGSAPSLAAVARGTRISVGDCLPRPQTGGDGPPITVRSGGRSPA
jgi:hypothetical protein